jgi:hypothetical protein
LWAIAQIKEIMKVTEDNQSTLLDKWEKFKQGKQVKATTIKK